MQSFVNRLVVSLSSFVVILPSFAAPVRAQHGDVTFYEENGAIGVGLIEESTSAITPGVRVFEATLIPEALPFSPFDFSRAEPGFDVLDGAMPASQAIELSVIAVSKWNGAGFDAAPGVAFGFDPTGISTDADGGLHEHVLFGLTDLTLDPSPLPDGVYLGLFRARTAGLADSPTIALVMLKDDLIVDEQSAEELEELLEEYAAGGPDPVYGGKNFAFFEEAVAAAGSLVPEPATAALVPLVVFASTSMSRRRRER